MLTSASGFFVQCEGGSDLVSAAPTWPEQQFFSASSAISACLLHGDWRPEGEMERLLGKHTFLRSSCFRRKLPHIIKERFLPLPLLLYFLPPLFVCID